MGEKEFNTRLRAVWGTFIRSICLLTKEEGRGRSLGKTLKLGVADHNSLSRDLLRTQEGEAVVALLLHLPTHLCWTVDVQHMDQNEERQREDANLTWGI